MIETEDQFAVEEISRIVKDAIESVIGANAFIQGKVNQWTNLIADHCLSAFAKLHMSFKYVVMCSVMQKAGAGIHTASSCFWNTTTDGTCTVRWENRTMYVIVTVFGVAL